MVLADTDCNLFEPGLPTRYYIGRSDVTFEHLEPSTTRRYIPTWTTSGYWSVRVADVSAADLASTCRTPLPAVAPIANVVAFYNGKVDIAVGGIQLARPSTSC